MPRKPRQFCASMGVRFGTLRTRIQLSPAEQHGGPEGQFRLRVNRRWLDAPDNSHLYFNESGLAHLVTRLAFGQEPGLSPLPNLPRGSRVSVPIDEEGRRECGFTLAPPMIGLDGKAYVAVSTFSAGAFMVCVDDIFLRGVR